MKITQLDIEGFRSLKKVSWKPGDLNVIIGPNGSGKSNLLRCLEMISAGAQGQLAKFIQAEGGIGALAWDGRATGIVFGLNVSEDELRYDVEINRLGYGSSYTVSSENLQDNMLGMTYIERTDNIIRVLFGNETRTARQDAVSDNELALGHVVDPFSSSNPLGDFYNVLSGWTIHQDVRVDQHAIMRQPAVTKRETVVTSDAQNLISVLHTLYTGDREFKQQVNSAMTAAFGGDFEELNFPPDADQRVQLQVRWKTLKREQSAADLSDGTLRFLFLLAVLASPSPAPLIAIDEPETGLHPSMLPIVAELAVEAARRTQVIFTTHSDLFLDSFRDTRPTTTVARWENGETILTTLADEDLAYWLKGYSMGNLFRTGELEALA